MHFSKFPALLLLSSSLLLQACGGAREEPFDPSDPDPEDPDPVTITLLIEDTDTRLVPEGDDKGIYVARTVEEYERLELIYISDAIDRPAIPDMDAGQVVFFDAGIVDNRSCARKLILRNRAGEATADDVVTLVLEHENFVPGNTDCTGDAQEIRPYTVLYVESRGDLMVREELQ